MNPLFSCLIGLFGLNSTADFYSVGAKTEIVKTLKIQQHLFVLGVDAIHGKNNRGIRFWSLQFFLSFSLVASREAFIHKKSEHLLQEKCMNKGRKDVLNL